MLKPRYRLSAVRGFYLTKIGVRITPGIIQQNDSIDPDYDPAANSEFTWDYTYGQSVRIRNEQESNIKNR